MHYKVFTLQKTQVREQIAWVLEYLGSLTRPTGGSMEHDLTRENPDRMNSTIGQPSFVFVCAPPAPW